MANNRPVRLATRKTISLPDEVWQAIEDFRFAKRIGSEAEAVRRIIQEWLEANAARPKKS
jgi:metal-responsive CopG/Arc/MetJ family transcriptional regulator